VQSYGDNNQFKIEAEDIVFDSSNPFGEVPSISYTVDSGAIHVDTTKITTDRV
jgi:hypothetical protein